jgi:excisionase family DNA binding protein
MPKPKTPWFTDGFASLEVEFTPTPRTLKGLTQIAAYLQISKRTAYRWIASYSLPAMQTPAGTWLTTTSLVDLWILAASRPGGLRPALEDLTS